MKHQQLCAVIKKHILKVSIVFYCVVIVSSCGSTTQHSVQNKAVRQTPVQTQTPVNRKFQGVYLFGGALYTPQELDKYASDPNLKGVDLSLYWSQIEPHKGEYHWEIIDQLMHAWVAKGKKVMLRISTAGLHWGQRSPYATQGTPQWVFDEGVPVVHEDPDVTLPQYWNPAYLRELNLLIHAFGTKYNGNPNVTSIEMAFGTAGESKVDTTATAKNPHLLQDWQAVGYTDPIWWKTIQEIYGDYAASFPQTPLAVMPNKTFIGNTSGYDGSKIVDYVLQYDKQHPTHPVWLQDNGLTRDRATAKDPFPRYSGWSKVPVLIEEQLKPVHDHHKSEHIMDYTLRQDVDRALALQANYFMVFPVDVDDSASTSALQYANSVS